MDSKDFRSKLRNHETPFNPGAWSQMEEMLDALPSAEVIEEEKPEKKRWLLLLLALLLLSLAGVVVLNTIGNNSERQSETQSSLETTKKADTNGQKEAQVSTLSDLQSDPQATGNQEVTNENKLANIKNNSATENQGNEVTSKKSNNSLTDTKRQTTIDKQPSKEINSDTKQGAHLNESQRKGETESGFVENTTSAQSPSNQVDSKTVTTETTEDNSTNQTKESLESTKNDSDPRSPDTTNKLEAGKNQNSESGLSTNDTEEKSETINQESESIDEPAAKSTTKTPLFMELLALEMLKAQPLKTGDRTEAVLPPSFQIDLIKERKLFYVGELGISDINSNRGYYIGAGVFWDIDKVIGLEPNLSFSSASDVNGNSTSPLQSAQELNLTLWIHLNLLKTNRHKLSIEAAPSLGATWSTLRVEEITEFDGISPNYKLGASYTYFFGNGNGIGVKGAFSRFDSGFVALKYFKKF